jgi:RNA 3'-terminal phosphate cyclase (ATP)
MGPRVTATLERPGFYPAGGGRFYVSIEPGHLQRLDLTERGAILSRRARALVAHLPTSIAERELKVIVERLGWEQQDLLVEETARTASPGNVVTVEIEGEHVTEVFTGFGERGVRAEVVAEQAAAEASRYLAAEVPVGEHLADQLLLPMALAGGGSFRTLTPTLHTTTNIAVLQKFLDVEARRTELSRDVWEIELAAG